MKYQSNVTGNILTEEEFNSMLLREYKDSWENDLNEIVAEFKEDGKSYNDYIEYMKKYDTHLGEEFEIIED